MSEDRTEAAWAALLDRFERDAHTAGDPGASRWHEAPGPLPASLAARARDIAHRQQQRIAQIAVELDDVRDQLAAIRAVPRPGDRPAYLDTTG